MKNLFWKDVIISLAFWLAGVLCVIVGATVGKHTYSSEVIDKMIELCHNNEGVEGFVSTNKELLIICNNGSRIAILTK